MFKIMQILKTCYFMFNGNSIKPNPTDVSMKATRCQYDIKKVVGVTDTTACKSRGSDVPGCAWV